MGSDDVWGHTYIIADGSYIRQRNPPRDWALHYHIVDNDGFRHMRRGSERIYVLEVNPAISADAAMHSLVFCARSFYKQPNMRPTEQDRMLDAAFGFLENMLHNGKKELTVNEKEFFPKALKQA